MRDPVVSVIIPTFNGGRWLRACLDSVCRQTYSSKEIIVIDDGSTDSTPEELRQLAPPVQVIRQPRGGIGAARNRGVRAASGQYLAFLDHDDLWQPDKLAKQVGEFRRRPNLDLLYTDATEFDESGTVHQSFFERFPELRAGADLFGPMVQHGAIPLMSTVLLRADFRRRHGLAFFEPAAGVDDLGLLLESAARGGQLGCLHERLVRRRLHDSNLSRVHVHRFQKRLLLYDELLRRPAFSASQQDLLRWGLRDAHYRVGEWHWGRGEAALAQRHFREALGLDRVGLWACFYGVCCRLPPGLAARLRAGKRGLLSPPYPPLSKGGIQGG